MSTEKTQSANHYTGLYRPEFEHDNCGIGAVVNVKGVKTHKTVENALSIVENLEHRAGKDAEGKTGDGVGILLQISHRFFSRVCKEQRIELGGEREYGIGMFFFPQDVFKKNQAKKTFESIVKKEGLKVPGMERSSDRTGCSGAQSAGENALYYAGIYRKTGRSGKGSSL